MDNRKNLGDICKVLDIKDDEARDLIKCKILIKKSGGYETLKSIHAYIRHLRGNPADRKARTQVELAGMLGRSRKTVTRLCVEHGLKKHEDGFYYFDEAKSFLSINAENALAKTKSNGSDNGDLRTHEIRYKKARADREELKAAEEIGRLVDISLVRQEVISREIAFKKSFMNLPSIMATQLRGCGVKEIEAILTKYVLEGFRKLAARGKNAVSN